jgi:hypothetical protein
MQKLTNPADWRIIAQLFHRCASIARIEMPGDIESSIRVSRMGGPLQPVISNEMLDLRWMKSLTSAHAVLSFITQALTSLSDEACLTLELMRREASANGIQVLAERPADSARIQ